MISILALVLVASGGVSTGSSPTGEPSVPKVAVGDAAVDGSFLKPYQNVWKIVYAFQGQQPLLVGTWSDQLTETKQDGRRLLERKQVANFAKYHITTTNTNVFVPETMTPISDEFTRSDTGEWVHREFRGKSIKFQRAKSTGEAGRETNELNTDVPVFDYSGGMYAVLLAAFPLREGYTATIPTLSEGEDVFEWLTFTVGKEDTVEAGPGKSVRAWPVTVDNSRMDHSTFWVSKEAPYVIKLVNIPAGKGLTVTLTIM
ncbi:MAG TPA: hypothetical protein VIX37_10690 [Candidatus Sulfotelmatobacter sp.]